MSDDSDPGPGGQLGPFRIGNRLGVGGMGIVYQALDTQLNRQVALKVISPHIGNDPEFRARFTREAQAQASLDSPHVIQVYSFGEAEGRLYIASQLIPDGDLGQMLGKHGRPPARIAVNLISQVADGLADAHAAGLIHRDIKPANVLLRNRDGQLQAYLGDFGIARQVGAESGLTQAGGTVGTPSYMAPELHLGSQAGQPSDLYSLGCLLWAALAGKAPYAGGTDYQIVMSHVESPVPQLAATGPLAAEINRVLRTAMAKQPEQRYASAAAMRDDLKAVVRLPEDPTPVRPQEGTPAAAPTQSAWSVAPPRTPTPTPTPMAPAAPAFRPSTPTPSTPQFARPPSVNHHRIGSDGPQSGRAGWVIAVVVVVLLVAGAILAAILIAGGDDGSSADAGDDTSPSRTTSTSSTSSTSGTSSTSSTSSPDDGGDPDGREAQAAAALAAGFAQDGTADAEAADCFGRQFVAKYGVDGLVEAGVLSEDLEFTVDETSNPEAGALILGGIYDATTACIKELTGGSAAS